MGINSDLFLDKRRANKCDWSRLQDSKVVTAEVAESRGMKALLGRPQVVKRETNGREKRLKGIEW